MGDAIDLIEETENLHHTGFDNRFSSCCFNGVWILYEHENFNNATNVSTMACTLDTLINVPGYVF